MSATKDLTRNFQGGGCKDTAQLPLLHVQNVGALCFYTTLVAIHEIVWGENDAVFLINTFHREREREGERERERERDRRTSAKLSRAAFAVG